MSKRTDIHKIMVIGAGPIVIGQGCEFDYSGVQACKALRREGYELVLVNSNPATIMTDPEMAERTYIEPMNAEILHEIIRRERPDALLPTLGGQTALNLAMELHASGILDRLGVEMIGADAEAIARAEDRQKFKESMTSIGLDLPRSGSAHSPAEAEAVAKTIGTLPLIIRPGFTLGGTGGGIAHTYEEFREIVSRGLAASLNNEVLIEESLLGWKEYEMEVMCDGAGNSVIVCSIENLDPMGVHTGDSITVAPIQTLSDAEYQGMRDDSLAVMRAIGVRTGGANVQWAVNPETGRRIIIEMNPRVSRSSALASKATGFPIAKIASLLAVGYTLDELRNDITKSTPCSFEPALDYVVTKVPRFAFEKFPHADSTLGTQMKSVGEAMAIGRTFRESFQKALRALETGHPGFGCSSKDAPLAHMDDETLAREVARPSAERIFCVRAAFRRGWDVERIHALTKIDRWFLRQLEELAQYEDEIAVGDILHDKALLAQAKAFGYGDAQIAFLKGVSEETVAAARASLGIQPFYGAVDTCAGEFEALTPYYYGSYGFASDGKAARGGKKRVMILGGGPNRIGQGIEFDYCCCHASYALRKAGYEVVMVNSNPETVSTDYDTADKLYFEPLTLEDIMSVYRREDCAGVIVQFGGQTPLNLAARLKRAGANILGTSPEDIDRAEDRKFFKRLTEEIGIREPKSAIACSVEEARAAAREVGYPLLVRPSFVLGGRGMVIVHDEARMLEVVSRAFDLAPEKPVLIDHFLENATELDVDCISDGERTVVGAVLEHIERAGIHSGDSASVTPPITLSRKVLDDVRLYAHRFAQALHVRGLMNMQFAVKDDELYMIEVNPRASRTVPFVSKAIGVSLAALAARVMLGEALEELNFTQEVVLPYVAVKEAVFPFVKFPGTDIVLSPEMKSTGEVMCIDRDLGLAYLKSQIAAGNRLPEKGAVFVSFKDEDKPQGVEAVRELVGLGYEIYSTRGTSTIQWIVNTVEPGEEAMIDEVRMRSEAVVRGIPITTTIEGLTATVAALKDKRVFGRFELCSLQEFHRHVKQAGKE